jgi:hypothetical protein
MKLRIDEMTCLYGGNFQKADTDIGLSLFRSQGIDLSKTDEGKLRAVENLSWCWSWEPTARFGNLTIAWIMDEATKKPLSATSLAAKVKQLREEYENEKDIPEEDQKFVRLFNRIPELLLTVISKAAQLKIPVPPILPSAIFFTGSFEDPRLILPDFGWEPANSSMVSDICLNKPVQYLSVSDSNAPPELVVNPSKLNPLMARVLALLCAGTEVEAKKLEWCQNYHGKGLWRRLHSMQCLGGETTGHTDIKTVFGRETLSHLFGFKERAIITVQPAVQNPLPRKKSSTSYALLSFILLVLVGGVGIYTQFGPETDTETDTETETETETETKTKTETKTTTILHPPEPPLSAPTELYDEAKRLIEENRIRNAKKALAKLNEIIKINDELMKTDSGKALLKRSELLKKSIEE